MESATTKNDNVPYNQCLLVIYQNISNIFLPNLAIMKVAVKWKAYFINFLQREEEP
jgi:hypothetical protein